MLPMAAMLHPLSVAGHSVLRGKVALAGPNSLSLQTLSAALILLRNNGSEVKSFYLFQQGG